MTRQQPVVLAGRGVAGPADLKIIHRLRPGLVLQPTAEAPSRHCCAGLEPPLDGKLGSRLFQGVQPTEGEPVLTLALAAGAELPEHQAGPATWSPESSQG